MVTARGAVDLLRADLGSVPVQGIEAPRLTLQVQLPGFHLRNRERYLQLFYIGLTKCQRESVPEQEVRLA
jgi:hypothetical protein